MANHGGRPGRRPEGTFKSAARPPAPRTRVVSKTGAAYDIQYRREVWLAKSLNAAPTVRSWSYRTRRVMLTDKEPLVPDFHVEFADGTTMFLHTVEWWRKAYRVLLQQEFDLLCPIPAYVLLQSETYALKRLFAVDYRRRPEFTAEERVRWGIPE
jgi:hypothetical protein